MPFYPSKPPTWWPDLQENVSRKGNENVPPENWAMSVQQFMVFVGACKGTSLWQDLKIINDNAGSGDYVTAYDMNSQFVIPWTACTGSSVSLHLNQERCLKAELMLSHAWGEDMDECMMALYTGCKMHSIGIDTAIWFCLFANYQPGPTASDDLELILTEEVLKASGAGPSADITCPGSVLQFQATRKPNSGVIPAANCMAPGSRLAAGITSNVSDAADGEYTGWLKTHGRSFPMKLETITGNGSCATVTITVCDGGVTDLKVSDGGSGYAIGDKLVLARYNIPGVMHGPSIEQQVKQNPFGAVLGARPAFGMMVIHTTQIELYSRLWCVYEISTALEQKLEVKAACSVQYTLANMRPVPPLRTYTNYYVDSFTFIIRLTERKWQRRKDCTAAADGSSLVCVKTAEATCFSPDDADMIRKQVAGNWQNLDEKVLEFRQTMCKGQKTLYLVGCVKLVLLVSEMLCRGVVLCFYTLLKVVMGIISLSIFCPCLPCIAMYSKATLGLRNAFIIAIAVFCPCPPCIALYKKQAWHELREDENHKDQTSTTTPFKNLCCCVNLVLGGPLVFLAFIDIACKGCFIKLQQRAMRNRLRALERDCFQEVRQISETALIQLSQGCAEALQPKRTKQVAIMIGRSETE